MKIGDRVLISPQVTGKTDWTEATVIEVEKNPYVGIVITAKADDGEIFLKKKICLNFWTTKYVCNSI